LYKIFYVHYSSYFVRGNLATWPKGFTWPLLSISWLCPSSSQWTPQGKDKVPRRLAALGITLFSTTSTN